MTRRPVLVDTAVLLYAVGADHPLKADCRRAVADPGLDLHASVEMVQEFVFHRVRVGDERAVEKAEQVAAACQLHPFDVDVLRRALALMRDLGVGGRDAVHAATALHLGLAEILSPDTDFDAIPGLVRLDPRDL